MIKSTKRISFFFLLSFALYGETGQQLPGYAGDFEISKDAKASPYLPGQSEDIKFKKKKTEPTPALPGGGTVPVFSNEFNHTGQLLPKEGPQPKTVTKVRKKEILQAIHKRGRTSFGLNYLYDTYTYSDSQNVFERVYDSDASDSHRFGMLQLGASRFFNRKVFDLYWKVNLGIGYNRGKGQFEDKTTADMHFQLWSVPLDLLIGIDVPLGWSSVMVGIAAGPSIMGLIQSRDDFDSDESGRRKRQYSLGYSYQLKFSLDLRHFLPSLSYTLYDDYSISRCYLNLIARGHSYSSFQDSDISITGISFGLGLTFEYL